MVVRHQTRRENSRPPRRAAGPFSEDEAKMAPGMRCVLPSAEYGHVAAANYISRPRWAAASVGATSPQSWPRYFVLSLAIPQARTHRLAYDTLASIEGHVGSGPTSRSNRGILFRTPFERVTAGLMVRRAVLARNPVRAEAAALRVLRPPCEKLIGGAKRVSRE